jgi:hypothetical protein
MTSSSLLCGRFAAELGRHTATSIAQITECQSFSRFLGIAIAILYRDHDPPHFHATYGEFEISVTIRDGQVQGEFPRRAQALVLEWLALHRDALLADWDRARRGEPLVPIPPLD